MRFSPTNVNSRATAACPLFSFEAAAALESLLLLVVCTVSAIPATPNRSPIPLAQIGNTVEKQYFDEGLSHRATNGCARLRCVFQKLEGEVTPEGL